MKEDTLFRKKERDGMSFHSRNRSVKGVAGFVLSLVVVAVFLVLCIFSATSGGEAGAVIGVIGLAVMVACGVAFSLCLKGLKEQDVYTRLPFAGLLISGTMFVVLFCLYVVGIRF